MGVRKEWKRRQERGIMFRGQELGKKTPQNLESLL